MNRLPRLLGRLDAAAKAGNTRTVSETLAELSREKAWAGQVAQFVGRMSGRSAAVMQNVLNPPPVEGGPGGSVMAGGTGGKKGVMVGGAYPTTAAALASAVGYGTWTSGWLCDEASGNLAAVFGSPTLTTVGTAVYGVLGPVGGSDRAVWCNAASTSFSGGDVLNVSATSDLGIIVIARLPTITQVDIVGKYSPPGYTIYVEPPSIRFLLNDGTDLAIVDATATADGWFAAIATLDRSTNKAILGIRMLNTGNTAKSGLVSASSIDDLTGAANFLIGSVATYGSNANSPQVAAVYGATGVGSATGLAANMTQALANIARTIGFV